MLAIIEIMRPKQWYKNLIIFAAIFFSRNLFNLPLLECVILGFVSLCLISSASYVSNDILDAQADKHHDKKKSRPIPSGRISVFQAAVFSSVLFIAGLIIAWSLSPFFFFAAVALVALFQAYNLYFKNLAFADISVLSSNFMVRAVSGAFLINVSPSPWLVLGAFLLALFLSIAKRKSDLESLGLRPAAKYKAVFRVYNADLLDKFLIVVSALLFITYCLYSFLNQQFHSLIIMMSIPVVFFLIFRYYYLASTNHPMARRAEEVFTDKQMVAGMVLWLLIFFLGIYWVNTHQFWQIF